MRAFVVVLALTGCVAQLSADRRSKSPRREAGKIALGGVAEAVVGGLILVGSYYWYRELDRNPQPIAEHETPPKTLPVLGFVAGGMLVGNSVADETIALWQVMANDYVLSPLQPEPVVTPQNGSASPDAAGAGSASSPTPDAGSASPGAGSASQDAAARDAAYQRWLAKPRPPHRCQFMDC